MSVIYGELENKYNGTFSEIEGFETGITLGNEYEQDISALIRSKLSALNEISIDNEDNFNETTISFAPKICFKQSVIIQAMTHFSLE